MPLESNKYKIEKLSDQLIRCEFLIDQLLSEELALEIFEKCNQLSKNKYKLLWIMTKKLSPDSKVMEAFSDDSRSERVIAEAFYLGSPALLHLANFYLKVKQPKIKSKAFQNETDALEWLKIPQSKADLRKK